MSIKKQSIVATIWSFLDIVFNKATYFITTFILARLIGPKDFGVVGIIAVFLGIGMTFVDSGLSTSLIRSRDVEDDYSTVFFSNLGLSIFIYFVFYFLAPFVANFYHKPVLEALIRVYCIGFILIAFRMVHQVILIKAVDFRRITVLNIPGNLAGLLISLFMAKKGYGVWSLVGLYVSTQMVTTILYWLALSWKPKLKFSTIAFKRHFNFGYKLMISANLNTVFDNIYNLIIGKSYSIEALSYYERAYSLNNYPISTISGIISKITLPILSQVNNDEAQLYKTYRKFSLLTFFITCPIMLGSLALAQPIIDLLLGPKWSQAVVMFQILCLAYMFYPTHSLNINLLSVFGRSDLFLRLEIIKKALVMILLAIGMIFGIYGLVWSSVAASIIALFINTYYTNHLIKYSTKKQLLDMMPTLFISSLMAIMVYFVYNFLVYMNLISRLGISIFVGIISFFLLSRVFAKEAFKDLTSLIKTN